MDFVVWTVPWVWAGPVELDVRGRELWEKHQKWPCQTFGGMVFWMIRLMEDIRLTSWGNSSFSHYLQGVIITSQVVVWDFWTINSTFGFFMLSTAHFLSLAGPGWFFGMSSFHSPAGGFRVGWLNILHLEQNERLPVYWRLLDIPSRETNIHSPWKWMVAILPFWGV